MNVIYIVIFILTLHFVADFPLQCEFLKKYKSKSKYLLFVHCMIYAGVVYGGLYYLLNSDYFIFMTLLVSHIFIDNWKCEQMKTNPDIERQKALLYSDQIGHLIVLGMVILVSYV